MKTKVFGKANDKGVHEEEMVVAKLVQNARANGLKWCRGALYRDKHGGALYNFSKEVKSCCAVGAKYLSPDTRYTAVDALGNDDGADGYLNSNYNCYSKEYLIGKGFRLAMGQRNRDYI